MALRQEEFTGLSDDVDLDRDRALVERCQAGDASAFGNLYSRYYERLLRFCLRRIDDRHEAEDAAQEAFARAWKALPHFSGERRFYPWLTVIAGNVCIDTLRRQARSTPLGDLERDEFEPVGVMRNVASDEVLIAQVEGELVHKALERLSVRHRHVLDMREGEGLTYQEMADHDGVEVGTIETLLWRARQALKREFKVLSEAKGAFGGALVGVGAIVRKGLIKTAHRTADLMPLGGSGALRNAVAGAAITSAAVVGGLVAPHALSDHHPSPAASTAAPVATPPAAASPTSRSELPPTPQAGPTKTNMPTSEANVSDPPNSPTGTVDPPGGADSAPTLASSGTAAVSSAQTTEPSLLPGAVTSPLTSAASPLVSSVGTVVGSVASALPSVVGSSVAGASSAAATNTGPVLPAAPVTLPAAPNAAAVTEPLAQGVSSALTAVTKLLLGSG